MTDHKGLSDIIKGGVSKAKGELKDQAGNATDNERLQFEGKKDKLKGEIQQTIGEIKSR